MRKRRKISIYIVLVLIAVAVIINVGMILYGNQWILDTRESDQTFPYGMILGASVKADGSLSEVLQNRVDAAILSYQEGRIQKILISGDDQDTYKEVSSIRAYLVAHNVPPTAIVFDAIGKNTYMSMSRAVKEYQVEKLLIFTQQYHLPRSIYIARHVGIDAWGYIADRHANLATKQYIREFFARIKSLIEVEIARPIRINDQFLISFISQRGI